MLPIFFVMALASPETPETGKPADGQVRQSVERSLVFLEKSGTAWLKGNKCASCHHVPISIWGMTEARRRGFTVDEKALEELRTPTLTAYANHPKFTPVGQDGGGQGLSLNTVYLTLAATSAPTLDEKTTDALKKFLVHLMAKQEADGSWKAGGKLHPVEDVTEVRTMQALLVLSAARQKGLVPDTWTGSRDKALAWLRKSKPVEQNQALVFQVLVAQRFGTPEEVQPLVKQLLASQNTDGGWSQTKDRASDALATGQSLFALAAVGGDAHQTAIERAQSFLVRTQTKDGSWLVPIRSQKNTGKALSHFGSGWATLGLLRTMPVAATSTAAKK